MGSTLFVLVLAQFLCGYLALYASEHGTSQVFRVGGHGTGFFEDGCLGAQPGIIDICINS